mgnify:CR=1 FL=1
MTCTPARRWILGRQHVAPGTFIAGVGADNHDKQEIEPELLAASVVVADILDQCATIGDLHHALDRGLMRREDVRAELADVIAGRKPGRQTADEDHRVRQVPVRRSRMSRRQRWFMSAQ